MHISWLGDVKKMKLNTKGGNGTPVDSGKMKAPTGLHYLPPVPMGA